MQDIRIFNCGSDRRLRTDSAINHQQALNCPRCESLNTKFCYYNNYNLSQPRYYCKACRRYWTKGGVLRNVPVGGGIRKAKRSSKTKDSTKSEGNDPEVATKKSDSNSCSERSSLTATATATAAREVISSGNSLNSFPNLLFATDSTFLVPNQIAEPGLHQQILFDPDSGGSMFTDILTSIADTSTYGSENQNDDQVQQMQNNALGGYLNQRTKIEFAKNENQISNCGLVGAAWHADDEQVDGIFDLTGNVDEAYWSQTQWPDHNDSSFHFHLP